MPRRVVTKVKQTLPGRTTWKRECNMVTYNVTATEYDEVVKMVNHTVNDCDPVMKQSCHDVRIPEYTVVTQKKTDQVTVMLPSCKSRIVRDRYCHTFPAGDMECQNQPMRRAFRISKIVCDVDRPRPFCFKFPVTDCR